MAIESIAVDAIKTAIYCDERNDPILIALSLSRLSEHNTSGIIAELRTQARSWLSISREGGGTKDIFLC